MDSEIRRFWKCFERKIEHPRGEITPHSLFYRNFISIHYQKDIPPPRDSDTMISDPFVSDMVIFVERFRCYDNMGHAGDA